MVNRTTLGTYTLDVNGSVNAASVRVNGTPLRPYNVLAYSSNGATPALNTDTYDMMVITGQTVNITSMSSGLTGTPTSGQKLIIAFTAGSGTPTITWGASFESSTATLPTTMSTTRKDVGFVWNAASTKWRCIAVA
jgi:hypothetical protein